MKPFSMILEDFIDNLGRAIITYKTVCSNSGLSKKDIIMKD